jgi:hypothetical protein
VLGREAVRALVSGKVRGLGEALVAVGKGTYVRLLSGVRPQMRPQVKVQRKPLAADVTLVGFLPLNANINDGL